MSNEDLRELELLLPPPIGAMGIVPWHSKELLEPIKEWIDRLVTREKERAAAVEREACARIFVSRDNQWAAGAIRARSKP